MNKHKKFIKDCYEGKHGTMCQDWKNKILEHYPEFKEEEFKVGDWVIGINGNPPREPRRASSISASMVRYNDPKIGEGENNGNDKKFLRKATPEEVRSHLIAEAEKRGFKKGCVHNIVNGDAIIDLRGKESENFMYDSFNDKLLLNGWCIYEKGQWAEKIQTMTKEEAEEKLNELGVNCKIV